MKKKPSTEALTAKLVWTSDPQEARRLRDTAQTEPSIDAAPHEQTITVAIDRKRRAGKTVTVASGFQLTAASLAKIATELKKKCGSGGTAKDAEIEIQGDHAAKIADELGKLGFRVKRR